MSYFLAIIGIVYGLAVIGVLAQIITALQRIAVSGETDIVRADALTKAQLIIAEAQQEIAQQQAAALADQAAYRDEQRQHMANCAKRYEALLAGELVLGETPVKH